MAAEKTPDQKVRDEIADAIGRFLTTIDVDMTHDLGGVLADVVMGTGHVTVTPLETPMSAKPPTAATIANSVVEEIVLDDTVLGASPADRAYPWGQDDDVMNRDPEQDIDGKWAWRFVTPCDDSCHHPAHAFKVPRGARHLEWFFPGSAALTRVVDT